MGAELNPETHFAEARGARLAYQKFGSGDHPVIAIPPLAQNIEIGWELPEIRAMLERFASFSTFVHFDKRGTGASDQRSRVPGIDERVDDVRAVMDAAGFERAHFFVQSDGGPMAILFAATYPHRVESLILFGAFAHNPPRLPPEQWPERVDLVARQWGTVDSPIVDGFAPSRAADDEYRRWHQRYERHSASTDSLRELLFLSAEMDVRDVLPTLDVPTWVGHRTGDRIIDVARGRELAAGIPGAELHEYDSIDHFAYIGSLDPWATDIERFVTGEARPRAEHTTPAGPVRITTLGRFDVEVDGSPVQTSEWGSRNARQVCKRLVAARGWPVTRDELIDMLWPDESDRQRLSARLSVQLSTVRRVLGGGVKADRERVSLDLGEVTTDLEDFHHAPDDAAVVDAYRGEFLPDDRYDDWSDAPRREARRRFVDAANRLASAEPDRVVELAGRILVEDPYDESAHHMMIRRLRLDGSHGEAAAAYAAYAAAMAELEVRPADFDSIVGS